MFEIGSISKSFVSLALLQLRDEGKLDLNKPIAEYLPWLKINSKFQAITTHHISVTLPDCRVPTPARRAAQRALDRVRARQTISFIPTRATTFSVSN
jgi:CubicO group peptidase (beta-lactamase class C family)